MLVRLMYASRAVESVSQDDVAAILKSSRSHNPGAGLTGVLCLSAGTFLQLLEGGRAPVSALYNRIVADPRHRDVVMLSFEEIGERRFAGWSMGQVNLNRLNPAVLMKYSETGTLDPFGVPGAVSMALFDELAASASIMA